LLLSYRTKLFRNYLTMATETTQGGYLLFDVASNGTMFIKWSKTTVENALIFFKPTKSVPGFKYKGLGKQELVRNLQESKNKYFQGVCEFMKIGRKYDSEFVLLPHNAAHAPYPVGISLLQSSKLTHVEPGTYYTISKQDAIASYNATINPFEGMHSTNLTTFCNQGRCHGCSESFEFN
jgi:hypothetical protein